MADSWRDYLCSWQKVVGWMVVTDLCPWLTVRGDSYVHVSWSISMMVGEDGYWLCPWQMVVEDGYVSMADSWR
jgi:hypothetical protein